MYTGNGATKKFLIPPEYDGREVYLTFSTGRSIKILELFYIFLLSFVVS